MGADVIVESAQDVVATVDHRHVGAEACEDAGELERDITAALDHDAPRQLGKMKRLVGGDHMLDARNHATVVRRPSRRYQHIFRAHRFAGPKPKPMGVLEY